jgi:ABC-type glycerol-3-phosphate transport system permease component
MEAATVKPKRTSDVAIRDTRGRSFRVRPGRVLLYLVLLLGAVFSGFPFVWMVLSALKTREEVTRLPPVIFPESPRWSNFSAAWGMAPFERYFLNSFFVAGCVVIGAALTSLLAGYAFARIDFPGRNALFALFLVTLMIPFESTLIPNFIIIRNLHWYNTYTALIAPWIASVFGVFLLRQFILSIPEELFEAATLDGCGHLGILRHAPDSTGPERLCQRRGQ